MVRSSQSSSLSIPGDVVGVGVLAVVWAAEAADLDLAADLDGHRVGELEGMEEGVGDDGGARVRRPHLHELGEHLLAEDAAVLVGERDGTVAPVRSLARLYAHVELACNSTEKSQSVP